MITKDALEQLGFDPDLAKQVEEIATLVRQGASNAPRYGNDLSNFGAPTTGFTLTMEPTGGSAFALFGARSK